MNPTQLLSLIIQTGCNILQIVIRKIVCVCVCVSFLSVTYQGSDDQLHGKISFRCLIKSVKTYILIIIGFSVSSHYLSWDCFQ